MVKERVRKNKNKEGRCKIYVKKSLLVVFPNM